MVTGKNSLLSMRFKICRLSCNRPPPWGLAGHYAVPEGGIVLGWDLQGSNLAAVRCLLRPAVTTLLSAAAKGNARPSHGVTDEDVGGGCRRARAPTLTRGPSVLPSTGAAGLPRPSPHLLTFKAQANRNRLTIHLSFSSELGVGPDASSAHHGKQPHLRLQEVRVSLTFWTVHRLDGLAHMPC